MSGFERISWIGHQYTELEQRQASLLELQERQTSLKSLVDTLKTKVTGSQGWGMSARDASEFRQGYLALRYELSELQTRAQVEKMALAKDEAERQLIVEDFRDATAINLRLNEYTPEDAEYYGYRQELAFHEESHAPDERVADYEQDPDWHRLVGDAMVTAELDQKLTGFSEEARRGVAADTADEEREAQRPLLELMEDGLEVTQEDLDTQLKSHRKTLGDFKALSQALTLGASERHVAQKADELLVAIDASAKTHGISDSPAHKVFRRL